MAEWLDETPEPLQVGGGCRSVSARIPATLVKHGAAWASHTLLSWLNSNTWPKCSGYGLQIVHEQVVPGVRTEWVELSSGLTVTGDDWRVTVPPQALSSIASHADAAGDNETGGVLVGELDRQRRVLHVTEAWPAPPDSEASHVGFKRGRRGLISRLVLLGRNTRGRMGYVGEWHSHPSDCSVKMSSQDSDTANKMAHVLERDQLPALCLITNGKEFAIHIVRL